MIKKMVMIGLTTVLAGNLAFALPNPASVYCAKNGGKNLIDEFGKGLCVFPADANGRQSYCEEWSFFRGECKPGLHDWPRLAIEPYPIHLGGCTK